jgi:WD40 repeat protein
LWDVEQGQLVHILSGHENHIRSLAFSGDGSILASGSEDNTIKLWDVQQGQLLRTLSGHTDDVTSIAFHPDGQTLASGSKDNTIKFWDVKRGELERTLCRIEEIPEEYIHSIHF